MALIGSLNGRAERQGLVLTLHTSRTIVVLTDISCDTLPFRPDCVHHKLVAYEPSYHMYLVENGYYEGGDYTWVNDGSGLSVRLKGFPHYSPNGRRFVIVNPAEDTSFNGIQLWRMQSEGRSKGQLEFFHPELVLEYSPEEYALYDFVAWENDESIQLRVTTWVGQELKSDLPARLFRRNPGWHLEGAPEHSR
jgi:hypothetical protein